METPSHISCFEKWQFFHVVRRETETKIREEREKKKRRKGEKEERKEREKRKEKKEREKEEEKKEGKERRKDRKKKVFGCSSFECDIFFPGNLC